MTNYISIGKSGFYTRQESSLGFPIIRDVATFAYLIIVLTANINLLTVHELQATKEVSPEGSLFAQITAAFFLSVCIFLQFFNQKSVRQIVLVAVPLLPTLIWTFMSITWSDFPDITVRRAVRLAVETTTAILLAAGYRDQYRLLRVLYYSCSVILAADIALLSVPDISFTPIGYAGVHESKQHSGLFCVLALPLFLLAIVDRRIFPIRTASAVGAIGCLTILALSLSKSAWAVTPVSFIIVFVVYWLRRIDPLTAFVTTVALAIATILVVIIVASVGIDEILRVTVGDTTLTGRDQIWDYALALFQQSPILGRGYGAVWSVGLISVQQLPDMSESFVLREGHNGYLDVMTESGLIGLSLAIIFLVSSFYRLWVRIPYRNTNRINLIAIFTIVAILLENTAESSIFRAGVGFWIYLLLVTHAAIFLPQDRSAVRSATQPGKRIKRAV